jgi:hypothetical protein
MSFVLLINLNIVMIFIYIMMKATPIIKVDDQQPNMNCHTINSSRQKQQNQKMINLQFNYLTYYNPKLPPPPLHDNPYYPYYLYYPPPHDFNKNPHDNNPSYSQVSSSTTNLDDNIKKEIKSQPYYNKPIPRNL